MIQILPVRLIIVPHSCLEFYAPSGHFLRYNIGNPKFRLMDALVRWEAQLLSFANMDKALRRYGWSSRD